jgi:Family of unknown function (DUF5681)
MSSVCTRIYQVGYKRPPLETRFKTGNKANPGGRPRGSKTLATVLDRALDTPVVVVQNGVRRKLTKRDVVIAGLVDRCAESDLRATKILLDMLHKLERSAAPAPIATGPGNPDQVVFDQLRARLAGLARTRTAELARTPPPESNDGAHPDGEEPDRKEPDSRENDR